jgi:peptide/nickel transport system substrate-binding protein
VSSVGELPAGTVTFLFTDIEGSTQLLKQLGGDRYGEALADHQRILRELFAEGGGHEIDTQGDSFFVAFRRAKDAVSTAVEAQRRLTAHAWPDDTSLRVRMGIHTGEPAVGGERYVGMGVHRAARICAAGHGGQVLVSQTTRELLRDDPIPEITLRDLGEHQLKDMDEPERIYQVTAPGLVDDFPGLKTAAPPPFEGREGELAEAATEELARRWRRPARRTLIAATFAAALVGVSVGVLLTQGGGSTARASVGANAVGVLDPEDGDIAAEIPVGVAPGGVAAGLDSIWVTNTGEDTVSRIDPSTNDVVQTIEVGGGPFGVAVTPNAVWVANGLDATVSRIDAETNRVSQLIDVGNGPTGVAAGNGAVWVTNSTDGTVSRIDPASGEVTRTFPAVPGASGIAVGFGRLWVVSPPSAKVVALDSRTGQVVDDIGVGVEPAAVAVGPDAVWVTNRSDGTVSKIEPRTGAVIGTVEVGRAPTGVAASPDAVWVANSRDGTLAQLDPSTPRVVKRVQLGNPPRDVVWRPEGAYVTVGSSGVEHRGGTLSVSTVDPDFIDPALAYSFTSWAILSITNDGLVAFRKVAGAQGAQLVPDLATALPVLTDSGRTYTFQVRSGIRYSNGALVQPEDFRRALERVFELGSGGAPYYAGIVGADRCTRGKPCDLSPGIVTDRAARTVVFRLVAPDGDFLTKLALCWAAAVPATTPSRAVRTRAVPATGPYRIAEYRPNEKVARLVRNGRFREWSSDAQPQGFPDSITVSWPHGFGDPRARVRLVERGRADIATGAGGPPLAKEVLEQLTARFPSRLRFSTAFTTEYFFLNTRIPPFDDVRVRRAVSNAFDPDAFAESQGAQLGPTCRILPPNFPGYQPTCLYASGGIEGIDRARKQVAAAGAAGDPVTVWMLSPIRERASYMASLLRSIGFRANVRLVPDPSVYFKMVSDPKNRAQIGFGGWTADFPSATGFLPPLLGCDAYVPESPEQNTNLAGFCDPSIDGQMARATGLQATNPPAATLLWQRIEQQLLAHAPLVPSDNRRNFDFLGKRVGNYQYNPQLGPLLSQLWVK